jgi:hypothetical protein
MGEESLGKQEPKYTNQDMSEFMTNYMSDIGLDMTYSEYNKWKIDMWHVFNKKGGNEGLM